MSDVLFPGRFRALADVYTTGRPAYPRLLARRVADLLALDGSQIVLDIGTGPGFLALDFAPFARRVVGIDPEPEMLRVARLNARRAGVEIDFVEASAAGLASLGPAFGPVRLVTIGRAFHWMERRQVLQVLDGLVEPGGAVALFHESYPEVPVNDWHASFQAIRQHYSVHDPARARTHHAKDHEAVLLDSPFSHLERIAVLEPRQTSVEHLVDRALSYASTWQGRPGSRMHDMAVEVRDALTPYARDGSVAEVRKARR